jgi:hypothetical protein
MKNGGERIASRRRCGGAVRTALPESWSFSSVVSKVSRGLGKLGPGIITGASDDDPSGIATS